MCCANGALFLAKKRLRNFVKASSEAASEDQSPAPALLGPPFVLIVDDNATNRRILEAQLKIWGMTPTSAHSGHEALEKLAKRNFDVVLIDLQMPEMDGITLAREIHKQ